MCGRAYAGEKRLPAADPLPGCDGMRDRRRVGPRFAGQYTT